MFLKIAIFLKISVKPRPNSLYKFAKSLDFSVLPSVSHHLSPYLFLSHTFDIYSVRVHVKTKKIQGLSKTLTLKKGSSVKLKPVLKPLTSQQKLIYTSSNKKVVTVSSKGVVKAKKSGKVTITVKSGSKKVKIKVTVK